MGRPGTMEELQNLATFLLSDGCRWLTGETIAMDGGQALATGGNFYELRQWSDAQWQVARDLHHGAERQGPGGQEHVTPQEEGWPCAARPGDGRDAGEIVSHPAANRTRPLPRSTSIVAKSGMPDFGWNSGEVGQAQLRLATFSL